MQRISVENLTPEMVVAKSIFDNNGTLLISSGVKLNEKIINRLNLFCIGSIYIKNPLIEVSCPDLEEIIDNVPELVQEKTRNKAIELIRETFKDIPSTFQVDVGKIKDMAALLVGEVIRNRNAIVHLTDIRTYDEQTFSHSVNVATMAALMGLKLGYSRNELNNLALGALLHDVGKMMIPASVLLKPGKLTDEEWVLVKQHPELGFEILRKNQEIPPTVTNIAYQHHEKYDGTGYCCALKETQIHEYSRIVSIADVYEALTSTRCYRKELLPHKAYEIMLSMSGIHFDCQLLSEFLKQLVIYPIGSTVELSNGMLGIVEEVSQSLQLRPVVKIISEKKGVFLKNNSFSLDLSQNLNITIVEVLTEEQICEIISSYRK